MTEQLEFSAADSYIFRGVAALTVSMATNKQTL